MYLRKAFVLVLTVLFLLSFTGGAIAREPFNPNLQFELNDDLTKVTINGITYDNIVTLHYFADLDKLILEHGLSTYLIIPSEGVKPPEKFFEYWAKDLRRSVEGVAFADIDTPKLESQIVFVNYKPWLESEISKYYFESNTYEADPEIMRNLERVRSGELLVSLEEVKDYPIIVREYELARNMEEFKKASSEYITLEGANVYNLQEYIKNFSLSGEKQEENVVPQIILQLDNKEIKVGEKTSELDVAPYNPSGTTLIPVRGVLEVLKATVEWLPDNQQVKINDNTNEIVLTINSTTALVNGKTVNLLEPATIINGRTFIPLRFISENLGYNVQWLPETKQIIIN